MVSKMAQKDDNLQAKLTIVFHKLAVSINTTVYCFASNSTHKAC